MIEGLKIKMPSDELKDHLVKRAQYHADKADEIEKDIPGLVEIAQRFSDGCMETEDVAKMSKAYANYGHTNDINDLIGSLRDNVRNRRNKAVAFRFLSEHLFGEDYNLQERDLVRLEILSSW